MRYTYVMSLQTTIKEDMIAAMRAKDTVKLTTLRGLIASFTNEALAKGKNELIDDEVVGLVKRAVKQRKDSIDQFTKGGRPELAAAEQIELKILESYLPATMNVEDIKKIAAAKKAELGITDKTKAGQLMGILIKELKGKADGADVKVAVEALF